MNNILIGPSGVEVEGKEGGPGPKPQSRHKNHFTHRRQTWHTVRPMSGGEIATRFTQFGGIFVLTTAVGSLQGPSRGLLHWQASVPSPLL